MRLLVPTISALFILLTAMSPGERASSTYMPREHDIIGLWEAESGNYQVEIVKVKGAFCGRLVWLQEDLDYEGKPIRDWLNPDPELRGQFVTGSKCLYGLEYSGEAKYKNGQVYDFLSGKTYNAYIELEEKDRAKLRGFVGIPLFGQTEYFNRLK